MPRPGSTTARDYGTQHQRERAQWARLVQAGGVDCHADRCLMPSREIQPNEPWDLGHTPDRAHRTGPEHRRCNRADGARRGNVNRRRTWTTSRRW